MPGLSNAGADGGSPPPPGGSLSLEEFTEWKEERDARRAESEALASAARAAALANGTAAPTGREMFELCPEVFDVDERGVRARGGGHPSSAVEVVTGVEGLGETMRSLPAEGRGAVGALFLADDDPATGRSWCPDCVMAGPVVRAAAAHLGAALAVCMVGDRATWKDPGHPLRNDPSLALTGVPYLVAWSAAGGWGRRFDLEACPDEAAVQAAMAEFLAGGAP